MRSRKSKTLAQGYNQMRESENALNALSSTAAQARSQMKKGIGRRRITSPSRASSTIENSKPTQVLSEVGGVNSFTFDSINPKVFG